jgi:hypothetical protein
VHYSDLAIFATMTQSFLGRIDHFWDFVTRYIDSTILLQWRSHFDILSVIFYDFIVIFWDFIVHYSKSRYNDSTIFFYSASSIFA